MSSVSCLAFVFCAILARADMTQVADGEAHLSVDLLQHSISVGVDSEVGYPGDKASLQQKLEEIAAAPEEDCLAWNMSLLVHEVNYTAFGLPQPSIDPAFSVFKKYEVVTANDTDKAWLWQKGDDCWMVFQGASGANDFGNLYNSAPITKWGVDGLNSGMVEELEHLVTQMNFAEIRGACPGKFTVAGFSMGGGLAQMFSVLVTRTADPLQAGITLDKLLTFGSVPVTEDRMDNEQAADGCFEGSQYWYAQPSTNNPDVYAIDCLYEFTGKIHEPVKSRKVFVFSDRSEIVYPCGTPTDDGVDLVADVGFDTATWLHYGYLEWLNCV